MIPLNSVPVRPSGVIQVLRLVSASRQRDLASTLHALQAEAMRQRASHNPSRPAVQRPLWEVSR